MKEFVDSNKVNNIMLLIRRFHIGLVIWLRAFVLALGRGLITRPMCNLLINDFLLINQVHLYKNTLFFSLHNLFN